jgi:hypothetical protein
MFTALGVLLTAYTLERPLQDLLRPLPDPLILEQGMDFLRSVSCTSTLAGRYVSILERFRHSGREADQDTQHHPPYYPAVAVPAEVVIPSATLDSGSSPDSFAQLPNLDFMDPEDLLFGIGLPHSLFNGDWSHYAHV